WGAGRSAAARARATACCACAASHAPRALSARAIPTAYRPATHDNKSPPETKNVNPMSLRTITSELSAGEHHRADYQRNRPNESEHRKIARRVRRARAGTNADNLIVGRRHSP